VSSALLAKFRQENGELRDRIAELSTAGFEGDQSTVGSLAAIARLAEEAETYSAKIEVEKRRIAEMEKNIRECDLQIRKNRDVINSVPSDSELRKKVGALCCCKVGVGMLVMSSKFSPTHLMHTTYF
jgi:uncharacterized coiled-coil DUF342 family protein